MKYNAEQGWGWHLEGVKKKAHKIKIILAFPSPTDMTHHAYSTFSVHLQGDSINERKENINLNFGGFISCFPPQLYRVDSVLRQRRHLPYFPSSSHLNRPPVYRNRSLIFLFYIYLCVYHLASEFTSVRNALDKPTMTFQGSGGPF